MDWKKCFDFAEYASEKARHFQNKHIFQSIASLYILSSNIPFPSLKSNIGLIKFRNSCRDNRKREMNKSHVCRPWKLDLSLNDIQFRSRELIQSTSKQTFERNFQDWLCFKKLNNFDFKREVKISNLNVTMIFIQSL